MDNFHIDIRENYSLSDEDLSILNEMWRRCAARIIISTTLAKSGHPGGSLSTLHSLLLLYAIIEHDPSSPRLDARDRVVMSIGHVSPAVYSVLCEYGYVREEDFLTGFRRAGSPFAGHVEQAVAGVEWNTGNLGQGLSVGSAMAFANKLKGMSAKTIVFMGDGEQQKGQVAEARRFASHYGLSGLYSIIDRNHLQIGGSTEDVMRVRVRAEYEASGWNVIYCANGNDFNLCYQALRRAFLKIDIDDTCPTAIVMRTQMGYGVSFMENKAKYHGAPLGWDEAMDALEEIGVSSDLLNEWQKRRKNRHISIGICKNPEATYPSIKVGEPRVYDASTITDCRSAYGNALKDIAELNNSAGIKVVGISCDLEGSVKMNGLHKVSPKGFIETGIQEHHAATMGGALSREGFCVFFSTFGVFAIGETYNQHRLNVLNSAHLKIVATHLGLDVGEDGPTHQCIDYVGLLRNLPDMPIFIPADPNQTDRIIRYVAQNEGGFFVGMGRSKLPVITKEDGLPFFDKDYVFTPGKADYIRRGKDATIISYGALMPEVMKAWGLLKDEGISVSVLNLASIMPYDKEAILDAYCSGPIITVEDHITETGIGSIVARTIALYGASYAAQKGHSVPTGHSLIMLGVNGHGASGSPADLYRLYGLDCVSIKNAVKRALGN